MNTEVKKRTWVKDAAIIFLAVLLVLTFFSSTILNASLTEVATQQVKSGTITAKVRGTGKVVANGNNNVKAKATVTIAKVMVRTGEEVKTGDVLFVLGEGDSDELEAAKNALFDMETSYNAAVAALPLGSAYASERASINARQRAVEVAQKEYDDAKYELKNEGNYEDRDKLVENREDLEKDILYLTDKLNTKNTEYYEASNVKAGLEGDKAELDKAISDLNYLEYLRNQLLSLTVDEEIENEEPSKSAEAGAEDQTDLATLEEQIKNLKEKIATLSNTYAEKLNNYKIVDLVEVEIDGEIKQKTILEVESIIAAKQAELEAITNKLLQWETSSSAALRYLEAENRLNNAMDDLAAAQANLAETMARDGQSASSAYISVQAAAEKIDRQKEKIKELAGEGEEKTITAAVSGTVTEVNCSSGDTVIRDDILAVIEVADMGYTVSFSVTNDQARRLKVGDEATISNFYWGNEIRATLKSIATDRENPQNKKVLTFDLDGNVTAGSELTISVGQKSANYDLVIPNSAIRSDNNGQFVLVVSAKNSPLGNRYFAKRVKVDVLAEDDNNSAVTAELDSGDFVITTTSAPVNSGEQVRLADSTN